MASLLTLTVAGLDHRQSCRGPKRRGQKCLAGPGRAIEQKGRGDILPADAPVAPVGEIVTELGQFGFGLRLAMNLVEGHGL